MFTKKSCMYDPIDDGKAEILRINADGSYNVIVVNVFYTIGGVSPAELEFRERAEGMTLSPVIIGDRTYGMWIPVGKTSPNEKASKLLGKPVYGNAYIIRTDSFKEYLEDEDIAYIRETVG